MEEWERSNGGKYVEWLRSNGQPVPAWLDGAEPGQRGPSAATAAAGVVAGVAPNDEEEGEEEKEEEEANVISVEGVVVGTVGWCRLTPS